MRKMFSFVIASLLLSGLARAQCGGPTGSAALVTKGTLQSSTDIVVTPVNTCPGVLVSITGTYSGLTVNFEMSDDPFQMIWYATTCTRNDSITTNETLEAVGANATQSWACPLAGASSFRVRASAFASGAANLKITQTNNMTARGRGSGTGGGGSGTVNTGTPSQFAIYSGATAVSSTPRFVDNTSNLTSTVPIISPALTSNGTVTASCAPLSNGLILPGANTGITQWLANTVSACVNGVEEGRFNSNGIIVGNNVVVTGAGGVSGILALGGSTSGQATFQAPAVAGTRGNPVTSSNNLTLPALAFAGLPACAAGVEGTIASITDSTTTSNGATITGGGTNHVSAYCNGTNWVVSSGTGSGGPVFNATNYGCTANGSTDNAACITAMFTASNAVTTGVPTTYFPCNAGAGCQYNINAGASTSPFNPTIPTTIRCDDGVTLNFTAGSTAHAMDIGPNNIASIAQGLTLANKGYTVEGCRFTGGATLTQGIFINKYIGSVSITHDTFYDFVPAAGWAVYCNSECWWMNVMQNYWWNDDSVARNFMTIQNANAGIDNEAYIGQNLLVCYSGVTVTDCGVQLEVNGFAAIYSNDAAGGHPFVRIDNHSNGIHIFENVIEIDVGAVGNRFAIESNAGANNTQVKVTGNNVYLGQPTDALVGPTTGADIINPWIVHDNWARQDGVSGLVFHFNNLAGQTGNTSRNNQNFANIQNGVASVGAVYSDFEPGAQQWVQGAAAMTLIPNASQPGVLQFYNQYAVTTAEGIGLNIPSGTGTTDDLWLSTFAGGAWTNRWKIINATGNLLGSGLVGVGSLLTSTAAITGAVPVKVDSANAGQVVVTTTTDTGGGIVVGVCANSPGAGALCEVVSSGVSALTLGTGTCSVGNFVIVDTTTNGRVKCTATFTAGAVIGTALQAQASVGSGFNVLVRLR